MNRSRQGLADKSPHPSLPSRRTIHLQRIVPMYDHQPIAREDIGQLLVQPVPAESVAPGCPSTSLSGLCVISGLFGARSAPIPAAEGRNPLGPGPDPYRGSGRTPTERARH